MSDYSESLILAPLVRVIDEQAPRLQIRSIPIDSIDLHAALHNAEVDLVIGAVSSLVEMHRHQSLCTEEFVCIARRGHPFIQGSLRLEDYQRANHIGLAVRGAQVSTFDEVCAAHGFQRKTHVVVPNFMSVPFMVAATDNIATMPRRLLRFGPAQLDLQILPLPLEFPKPTIRQFWPERNHQDPVCRWLRDEVYKICQRL